MAEERINLVFLHYFGGSAESWRWVIEELPEGYHPVPLNLPGFGGTLPLQTISISEMAEFVIGHLIDLGIRKTVLIGHSMGGKIALKAAGMAGSGAVAGVLLLAPSPPDIEPMPEAEKERMLHHPDRKEAEKTVERGTVVRLSEERFELAVKTQLEIDEATWRWWILEGMDDSIADEMAKLSVPVRVVGSEDDPVITPEVIRDRVMRWLPGAELRMLDGAGHLLPLEVPEEVAGEIVRFVGSLAEKTEERT